MKEYKIPIEWQMFGYVEIKAESLEKAVEYFCENENEFDIPSDSDYIDGSFKISTETSPYKDTDKCVEELKEFYNL